jgi:hypothetical protein
MQMFRKVIGRAQSSGAHACRCMLARHDCSSVCLLAKKFPPTPTLPRLHAFFVGMLGRGKNWAVGLIGSRLVHSPVNTTFDTAFFKAPGMALAQSYSCPASQKDFALARPQAACREQPFAPTVGSWLGGGPNKGALFEVISPFFVEPLDKVRGSPDSAHIWDVVSCLVASRNPKITLGTTDGLPS